MGVARKRKNIGYGVGAPLLNLSPLPIIANRDPATSDSAEIGTTWIRKSTNDSWVITSVVANSATWVKTTLGSGGTIAGDLIVTGSITSGTTITAGTGLTVTAGDLDMTAGDIEVALGSITTTVGDIISGALMTCGTGLTVTAGGITITAGNLGLTAGNMSSSGHITGSSLYASGDAGGGAGTFGITNVVDETQGVGVGSLLLTGATSRDNTGFLKVFNGLTTVYIPYFDDIS